MFLQPKDFVRDPAALAAVSTVQQAHEYTRWLATHHYENFHVVSWLFTLAFFWVLDYTERNYFKGVGRHRKLWALPLLMLVWVNVHGGFVLGLAEGLNTDEALRFGSAVAGIKCSRIGGSAGAPTRAEVEAFLAAHRAEATLQKS